MKKYYILALGLLAALVSCNKEAEEAIAPENSPSAAPASFVVSSPETKTTLDGLHVKWAAGDEIRVYGHNTDSDTYTDNAVYELTAGAGDGTATFTLKDGETGLSGSYDEYYAVYPGNLTITGLPTSMTFPRLNSSPNNLRNQNPTAGQYDHNLAIMTAKYDGARLVFRHAVAYVKLTIPDAGVTRVNISFGNNCLADTPTYDATTGALTATDQSSNAIQSKSLTFTQNATYYFPAIPRYGDYSPTSTVITLTGGKTYTTSHFNGIKLVVGEVYDLGKPVKTPSFSADNVTIEANELGGTINFSVADRVDGASVFETVTSDGLTNSSWGALSFDNATGNGSISFTCDANEDTVDPKAAVIHLEYKVGVSGSVLAEKDITVTQKKKGSVSTSNTYWLYYGTSDSLTNTDDYYTLYSVTKIGLSASVGGAASFTVESKECTNGLYLDAGSDYIQFTTSVGCTATVTYYYVATVESDAKGTRTKLTDGTTTTTTSNISDLWGNYASSSVDLSAGTEYKIQRDNKKPAILLVKVVETIES